MGFGIMGNYHNKNMSYSVKWVIDDVESEEYEIERSDADDKDQEKKWFEVTLEDLG